MVIQDAPLQPNFLRACVAVILNTSLNSVADVLAEQQWAMAMLPRLLNL